MTLASPTSPRATTAHDEAPRRAAGELVVAGALVVAALGWDPSATASAVKSTLVALAGIVALGVAFVRVRERWARRAHLAPATVAWTAWLAWMLASSAWASHPLPVVTAAWAGAAGLALCVGTLEPEPAQRLARRVASWLVVGSGAACLIELALGAPPIARHGLHGNPNWLGLVVASALPLGLEQAAIDWRARRALRAVLLGTAALLGLVLASSRVAWVALGVAATTWSIARYRRRAPALPRLFVALGTCMVAAAVVALVTVAPGAAPSRAGSAAESAGAVSETIASWGGRLWIWRATAAVALRELPFGVGLGDFHAAFLAEQGARLGALAPASAATTYVNATTAHGDWLEGLATAGPLATLLLGAAFGLAFVGAYARWPAAAGCLVTVAVAALGDNALGQPALLVVLALVLGAVRRPPREDVVTPTPHGAPPRAVPLAARGFPRRGVALAVVHGVAWAAAILLLPLAMRAWLSERTLHAADALEPAERIARLEIAARIDTRSGLGWLRLGIAQLQAGDAKAALDSLEHSRRLLPAVATEVALGNALVGAGRPSEAVRAYDRALALHPGSFRARLNRAEAERLLGALDAAEQDLAVARALQPGHPKVALVAERLRKARIERDTAVNAAARSHSQAVDDGR